MSKLELAKEKIKEFYPKILLEVLDVLGESKFDENEITSDIIGKYAAKSFELNYGDNKNIVDMVVDTEDVISLNALVMFMCVNANYAMNPLNTDDKYYVSRFRIADYFQKVYGKTVDICNLNIIDFLKIVKEDINK